MHLIESSHVALQQELGLELWHAWIRYVPIPPDILVQSVVIDSCIQALQSPETMEVAIDVLVEILRMYPSHVLQNHALVNVAAPQTTCTAHGTSTDKVTMKMWCEDIVAS